jgi:hypothetical protein
LLRFAGTEGLSDQDHRALQEADRDQHHHRLGCKPLAQIGKFVRTAPARHHRIDEEHEDNARARHHDRRGKT